MSPARWCPTPEQLMILEEMYKSGGIRTPNASQIQQITAHLSYYGKIEGKNVFYWFQNHKARDRQKLRRKLIKQQQQNQQNLHHHLLYYHDHSHAFSPTPHQLSNCTTAAFLPQGGFHEEASTKGMNYTWKVEKPVMRMYGRDWTMIMDVGPISSPCQNGPLKTLDLFPITATNLKDEGNITSSKPCSTTSSN